jgi:uncharacterized protein YciI
MTKPLTAALALALLLLAQTPSTDLYYLVFLRPDPARKPLAPADAERLQSAHMANIRGMAERGVLVAAGPFGDTPPTIGGVFIFKTASLDEARRIAAQDPTVLEHRNLVDAYPWRGPAGIGAEYFRLHKQDPRTPEDMGVHPFCMLYRERPGDLRAHNEYLAGLRRDGKLAASGDVEGDPALAAIVIFNRLPDDEARRLIEADPAVKSGLLRVEYHRWWCAAHVLPW